MPWDPRVCCLRTVRGQSSPPVKSMPGNPSTGVSKDCGELRIDKVPIPEKSEERTLRKHFVPHKRE